METFSALLTICAGNSPVTSEVPTQRPVKPSFDVFFDLCLNRRLSKQWWGWWFEMPSCPSWCHCNDYVFMGFIYPYSSGLLRWQWRSYDIVPVPSEKAWSLHVNTSHQFTESFDMTTTKQTKNISIFYGIYWQTYRKISNIRRTKSQTLNVSRLVLQLSLPNPMKPGVKSKMKM